jgi:phospholipid-binding lipoprotein MlaA
MSLRVRQAHRIAAALLCVIVAALSIGCAHTGPDGARSTSDPWERMNRGTFAFNEGFDQYLLGPVASGWDFVMPDILERGLLNFFSNLRMPVTIANDILQLKPKAVGQDLLRVVENSVWGMGGFIDIASMEGVPRNDEDFGQTLGYWGVPNGPYFVIPVLGPSSARMTVGLAADTFTLVHVWFIPFYASTIMTVVDAINLRAHFDAEIRAGRRDAFDFYIFMREAYLHNLEMRVRDGQVVELEEYDDHYYWEEDELEAEASEAAQKAPGASPVPEKAGAVEEGNPPGTSGPSGREPPDE